MFLSVRSGSDKQDDGTFLDQAIGPTSAMGGGMGPVVDVLKAGINFLGSLFGKDKKEKKRQQMLDAYRDSENRLHGMMKERRAVTERRNAQKKEAMERLAKLRTLSLQQGILL